MKFNYYRTGGELNTVCKKYELAIPEKVGFSCSDIMRKHKPTTEEELLNIISKDIIIKCAKELYYKQIEEGYKNSKQDCVDFFYTLLVINTLKGFKKERELMRLIIKEYEFACKETSGEDDMEYAVDFTIWSNDRKNMLCGIQLKPESYKKKDYNSKKGNIRRNNEFTKKYAVKVYTAYYNDFGQFPNITDIVNILIG
jgi:hypothetical protein